MREMKDSGVEWIGEIPKDWRVTKIKHHFNIGSGTTPKSENPEFWDGDIVWITPADFKTEDVYVSSGHRNLSSEGFKNSSLVMIPRGNIIFSKRAPIGQVVINDVELCTNQGCLYAIPKDDSDVKYYRYVMSIATEEFELAGSGTTFKEISATGFGNIIFPLTSVDEQKRISDYLDSKCARIDSIIEKQQAIIEKLKEYKLSVITEAVTKGLDPDVEMKDSGNCIVGDVPEHWKVMPLKYLYDNTNGSAVRVGPFGSAMSGSDIVDEGVWIYNQRTILDKNFDTNDTFVSEEKAEELSGFKVKGGDILITTRGTIGKTVIVPEDAPEGVLHPCVIRFRVDDSKYCNRLLVHLFNNTNLAMRQILDMSNSTTIEVIYSYSLKEIKIPVPPINEQLMILEWIDNRIAALDKRLYNVEKTVKRLQEYKKSLIYEVVTGKKEV